MGFVFFIFAFILGIAGVFLFLIIIGAILFIFLPCLIIAIINLVKGIQNHWPKRNLIPFIELSKKTPIFYKWGMNFSKNRITHNLREHIVLNK